MKAKVIKINSAVAEKLLEKNDGNRTVSPAVVSRYARDMKAGRWKTAGNPINIGPNGKLLNGQHRLLAIISSGVELEAVVVTEDSDEVFDVYDTGRTRGLGQLLQMHGLSNTTAIGGIARLSIMYEMYPSQVWSHNLTTRQEIIGYVSDHRDDLESVIPDVNALNTHVRVGKNWYGTVDYLVSQHSKSPQKWADFHESVSTGIGLEKGDPRLALRNYFLRKGAPTTLWEQQTYVALGLIAWNRWLSKDMETLQLKFMRTSLPMPKVS